MNRVIFVHIHKTAGTALRTCAGTHIHHAMWSENDAEQLALKRVANEHEYQRSLTQLPGLISGHFSHYSTARAFDDTGAKFFTVLRSPKERVLSLYYFLQAHKIPIMVPTNAREGAYIAKSHNLAEFLACPAVASTIDNYMIRALSRYTPPALFSPLTRFQIDDAKNALRDKFIFAVQERLDEGSPFFFRMLGIPVQSVPQENVRKVREENDPHMEPVAIQPITPQAKRLLERLTQHDQELYDYALSIFDEKSVEWDAAL